MDDVPNTANLNVRVDGTLKKEADDMIKHPDKYKSYKNVQEMIDDILNEN